MVSVQALANTILRMGNEENISISPMKLQKLMYFVCAEYARRTGETLISESFCVWQYGPVLTSIYDEFKSFHGNPIDRYAKNSDGKSYALNRHSLEDVYDVIDDIWNEYSGFTAMELSRRTHTDGSGWSRAYERHSSVITLNDMIEDDTF